MFFDSAVTFSTLIAGPELDLVARDRRSARVSGHLGVDAELLEHLGQAADDLVAGPRARLVGRAGPQHVVARQAVDHVAGQLQLLHALRDRRVRGRHQVGRGVGHVRGVRVHDGDRLRGVRIGVRVVEALATPLLQLAVGQHGAVVRRVAHLPVELVVGERAAPTAADAVLRQVRLGGRAPPEHPVAERGQLGRDLVDRRRGDHEQPEEGQEQEQRDHDVRRAQQVEQEAGDDVPDRAAGAAEVGGVAVDRLRVAGSDVHGAEHSEGEGHPADDLPAGRTVALGVAEVAPADPDQHQRDEPADLADRAGHDRAHRVHQAAGKLPPDGRGDDDGQPEQGQPEAVAPVLGLDLAGRVPDLAGHRSDGVGDAHPDRGDPPAERAEQAQDRAAPRADRSGRRASLARTAARARARSLLRRTPGARRRLAPAARTRRGRRTGRHGDESKSPSLPSHASHAARAPRVRQRRSSSPRTYCACPRWALTSLTTLTRRTPRVTGGSHASSTTRSRSSGCTVATYAALRAATAS